MRRASSIAVLFVLACAPSAHAVPRVLQQLSVGANGPDINGVSSVVVTSDGAHVYGAGSDDYSPSVAAFSRDSSSGALSFVQQSPTFTYGLRAAISPDDAHVYVTSSTGDTLGVYARNAGTGALTFVEMERDGVGGVDGLESPVSVTVSPDGAHVYVAASVDDSVAVFSRDAGTGAVAFVAVYRDGVGGVDGLTEPTSIAISSDGAHVYVTSYQDDAVARFSRNAATGVLTFLGIQPSTDAAGITLSPDGAHAYVGSFPRLTVYSRDAGTGALAFVEEHVDGAGGITALSGCDEVTVSPDGAHVYASGEGVVVFSRNSLTGALSLVEEEREGVAGVQGLEGPEGLVVSPDGSHLYVAGSQSSALVIFSRAPGTGLLTFEDMVPSSTFAPYGATAMAMSPDGAHAYKFGNNYGRTLIAAFARDGGTGALTYVSAKVSVDGTFDPSDIGVSPDGANVYTAAKGSDAVVAFARDAGTGALTALEVERDGVAGVDGLDGANGIAVSPDGAHVYVISEDDDAVAAFARAGGTGLLAFVEAQRDGVGGVDGLDEPTGIVLSPDGAHVYVTASNDDAVSVFGRNAATGALTLVATYRDGVAGLEDLDGPIAVDVSPDGAHVYVVAYPEGALSVFAREAATGALTLLEVERDGRLGVSGLLAFDGKLLVSPDGQLVLASGAVFERDPASGKLAFVDDDGVYRAVLSPLGDHIYPIHSSSPTFAPGFAGCESGPLAACRQTNGGFVRLGERGSLVQWLWTAADPLEIAAFGLPDSTTSYALCMWDATTSALRLRMLMPRGNSCGRTPCWIATGTTGFRYKDRYRTPEGTVLVRLKAGDAGRGRIVLRGGKDLVDLPSLPLPVPVRVQLQASNGECWEGTYSSPSANDPSSFLAPAD